MRNDAQQEIDRFLQKPTISILMPVYNPDVKWLTEAIESVRAQIYPNWELCIADDLSADTLREVIRDYARQDNRIKATFLKTHEGISGATEQALSIANGQFIGFLDHDDKLADDALFEVARALNVRPELDFIYTDEDILDEHGRRVDPFFKPDWSPDLLLSMNYVPHLVVYRKEVLLEVGSVRKGFEGSQDYDLALRVTERSNRIGHVAKPVYSWRRTPESTASSLAAKPFARDTAKKALKEAMARRGIEAEILDGYNQWYRIRYRLAKDPLISIIVVTHDKPDLLKACLESIRTKTSYKNYEIIVVDHRSEKRKTMEYLRSLECKVIRYDEEFNFAKINNFASERANGNYLLFLNDDTEVIESLWLEEMVSILESRADVGIVGAKLLYKDRRIQHAGVILGCGGSAGHPFRGIPDSHSTYFGFAHIIRNCIAVTAACMMIKRQLFDDLKGFDVNLTVGGNDVDLCIRAYQLGYLTVYTPYAVLYHLEGSTRRTVPLSDYQYFTKKWEKLLRYDPFYNVNLCLESEDKLYTLDSGSRLRVTH
jgi:GT2 family glycosyltransferase